MDVIIWTILCEVQHHHELTHRRAIPRDGAVHIHTSPTLTSATTRICSSCMHLSVASRPTMAKARLTNTRWQTGNHPWQHSSTASPRAHNLADSLPKARRQIYRLIGTCRHDKAHEASSAIFPCCHVTIPSNGRGCNSQTRTTVLLPPGESPRAELPTPESRWGATHPAVMLWQVCANGPRIPGCMGGLLRLLLPMDNACG
jgi:hypothetical protein